MNNKPVNPKLIFAVRLSLAMVWLYNGLWLKVIALDAHHLEIMRAVCGGTHAGTAATIDPVFLLRLIGSCETLLGLGALSGLFYRFVSYFQIAIVLLMNVIGAMSSSAIAHPFGLIISNLPLIACASIVAANGPGAWALRLKR